MTIILLVVGMIFNLLAQFCLKTAVSNIKLDTFNMEVIFKIFSNLYIWFGAILYGSSFFFYVLALSRGELSRISPVSQALTTLGVVTMSILVFQEPVTVTKMIGVILLIIGTIVIFL
ncbi:hypothetical protein [Paenibacillus ehimensis]|uniref:EamA domain-containing protein n=1 Tax=Paenibacillus ehimensis TaxID=79264 RepID=A0ABT8VH41_9BACL|nr:hypothetical protein [Paenibacillus ehimensis]MDO3680292.1 hypothetical protein [Paenibacillus ehimensis]